MSADYQDLAVDASESGSSVGNNELLLLHTDSIADQGISEDDEQSVSDDFVESTATQSTIEAGGNGSEENGIHNAKHIMLELFGTDYSDDEIDLPRVQPMIAGQYNCSFPDSH
ncbi:hypothetical protein FGB62_18g01 [Gracilaria domingensis]|nr:hypothetical protein FGB62_18g01 [Gracilaria domingensis]